MEPTLTELFWPTLALVLVLEGLLPFVAPSAWRKVFIELMKMQDGQIRFFGLCCLLGGVALWWLAV
jgi:uncharacterized protein